MSTSNGSAPTGNVTDQVADAVARGQQLMTELAGGVTELFSAALSGADDATRRAGTGTLPVGLSSAGEFVDRAYDTGIAVLEMQRSMAHQMLGAVSSMRLR
ncbi:hypothetical protein GCM10023201_12480 [Actinomycetospora corticicola]|uniref:Uncharacterized protein n=1 Tax=Actinomycetospora corticicola TaxID=663602 RepID=A0A7Y9E040_9PSEU|nr:hypothetical protein [Actinomycetospora corticicola]NYD38432.1 hypothetical protein [Actinomycetospora corticicola]